MDDKIKGMLESYLETRDFSPHTRRGIRSDWMKFVKWFETANQEPLDMDRVTVQDIADFRDHLRDVRRQAVSTINRALVSLRQFLSHLEHSGELPRSNPAIPVKELRRMVSVPKGLSIGEVRKIMREVEIRQDLRGRAIISLMLFSGLRVGDVATLEIQDVEILERSGRVLCRQGKGNKMRTVPLCLQARRSLADYLATRPPVDTSRVFVGERGPLTENGIRLICNKYSAITGVRFHPHLLRHTFAHRYLQQSNNDLVGLAQLLGHENLNTTAIYTKRSQQELADLTENLRYE